MACSGVVCSEPRLLMTHALGFYILHLFTYVAGEKRGVGRYINGAGVKVVLPCIF